ncbi:AAA family ATPase [Pseudoroseicyclus sp. H15]
MATVTIRDFSCIEKAEVDLKKVTVLIGPQGSGKSVFTKVVFFMNDIVLSMFSSAEDGISLTEFKRGIERSFAIWFPPMAWGSKRFIINFTEGNHGVRVLRRRIEGKLSDEVSVRLSPWTERLYFRTLQTFERVSESAENADESDDFLATSPIEISSRVRSAMWAEIGRTSGGDLVRSQTFIPAGRAFFTSIGRMVAGLEQGVSLDPATLRFARLFARWRDQSSYLPRALRDPDFQFSRLQVMTSFFGGVIQLKRESEYIEMQDGRKVPFSSLSSGQQELLPIWYFIDNVMNLDERMKNRASKYGKIASELVYIEEPEAHLFPNAQSDLLDVLISKVASEASHRKMVITTHSPYIMSRLNVLLKAGSLSKRKKKNKEIGEIVPRDAWLKLEDFSALKIENGVISSIVDQDEGLVDAEFLDKISDVISSDFSDLLDIEEEI